jgi:hypothetical protein
MSQVLTVSEICGRALRAIGSFPLTETAPDGEALREAMSWLDLIMAEFAGAHRLFFLVPDTIPLTIEAGKSAYDLETDLGADLPLDGIQFPAFATLDDGNGNRSPVEIVARDRYELLCRPAQTGTPKIAYVDRLPSPTLRIYPTPASSDPNTYTLMLVVQRYAPNVAPTPVSGVQANVNKLTGFRQAWQRWLVAQLAHDLGSGPIKKLPEPSLTRFSAMAAQAKSDLLAFENREHETTPPICEAWGLVD